MCEPTTALIVTGMIVAAGATAYAGYQEREALKDQNAFIKGQNARQREAADESAAAQQAALRSQGLQDEGATAAEQLRLRTQSQQALASARAGTGEANVRGNSVQALLGSVAFQGSQAVAREGTNLNARAGQRARDRVAIEAQRRGRINPAALNNLPSYGNIALNAGVAGFTSGASLLV